MRVLKILGWLLLIGSACAFFIVLGEIFANWTDFDLHKRAENTMNKIRLAGMATLFFGGTLAGIGANGPKRRPKRIICDDRTAATLALTSEINLKLRSLATLQKEGLIDLAEYQEKKRELLLNY